MSAKSKHREARWAGIFQQLQEDQLEFFLNTQLEPTVLIPNDGFQTEWPVDSQRFRDLLTSMHYEISQGEILKTVDREFLTAQIREECRKGGRRLTEPEAAETEQDVIVQAILSLMNRESRFSVQTAQLVKTLKKIQRDGGLSSTEEIPIFTNIFSRKLSRLIPVLRGYGIEVTLEHKESGSHCLLTRTESFQKEPMPEEVFPDDFTKQSSDASSGGTPGRGKDLPLSDGADGEYRADPPKSSSGAGEAKGQAAAKKGGAK